MQFLLGAFSANKFDANVLEKGPVRAAMMLVNYPIVSIVVGLTQVINGVWGIARSKGLHNGPDDFKYQMSIALQWVLVLCLQDIMQISYLDMGTMAPLAPGLAAVSFGINMMPAFLDQKMRTLPEELSNDYYYSKVNEKQENTDDSQTQTAGALNRLPSHDFSV